MNAIVADSREFDYGREHFDLVAAIYVHRLGSTDATTILESLKPGGILVMEAFHRDQTPFGYGANELLETFGALRILYYEEAVGLPDQIWTSPGDEFRFVRLVGEKR